MIFSVKVIALFSFALCSVSPVVGSNDHLTEYQSNNDETTGIFDALDWGEVDFKDQTGDEQDSLTEHEDKGRVRFTREREHVRRRKKRRKKRRKDSYKDRDSYSRHEKDRYEEENEIEFLFARNGKYPGYTIPPTPKEEHHDGDDKLNSYYAGDTNLKSYYANNGEGYRSKNFPFGKIVVAQSGDKNNPHLKLYWKMQNLDPYCENGPSSEVHSNSCGVHIHKNLGGYDACKQDPGMIGGHKYKYDLEHDPWMSSTYYADKHGASRGKNYVDSGLNLFENKGCVVVFHNQNGDRISCGVLRPKY